MQADAQRSTVAATIHYRRGVPSPRPPAVTTAAVLLAANALPQLVLCVLTFAVYLPIGLVPLAGMVGFAAASLCVWHGVGGARMLTWSVALLAGPCCGVLGYYLAIDLGDSRFQSDDVTFAIVLGLSALALIAALACLTLPSSNAHFKALNLAARQAAHTDEASVR
jgi:hypothetical protein